MALPPTFAWVTANNGNWPANTIMSPGGVYAVGRSTEKIPGKVHPGHRCLYFSNGGREHKQAFYEVLTASPGSFEWIRCGDGLVPERAIRCGDCFVGDVNGTPGKIVPSHKTCYYPYGGEEHHNKSYLALAWKEAALPFVERSPAEQWPCAMISARFDGGEVEMTMRKVHERLRSMGRQVLMVNVRSGQDFGITTMEYLEYVRQTGGVMIAVCTDSYGEETASPYSSFHEVKYAIDYNVPVLPLQFAATCPNEPRGDQAARNLKYNIRPNVKRIDCRRMPYAQIAEEVGMCLRQWSPAELGKMESRLP